MSDPWPKTVRAALADPRVMAGIGEVARAWMKNHIAQNQGRGAGGAPVEHKPLKTVTGRYWTARLPKNAAPMATRVRTVTDAKGRKRTQTVYLLSQTSFRAGGRPLRDTGKLIGSLGASASGGGDRITLTMRGNKYGLWQDRGFTTKGPVHYIPLTKRGRSKHKTGGNPDAEGLVRGKDYVTWGSKKKPRRITVPSRPFILPTRADVLDLGRSIYRGLRAVLKG